MVKFIVDWMLLGVIFSSLCMIYVYATCYECSFKDVYNMWKNGMKTCFDIIVDMRFGESLKIVLQLIALYLLIWPITCIKMVKDADTLDF